MISPGGTTVRQVISRARLGQNGPAVTVTQKAAPVPTSVETSETEQAHDESQVEPTPEVEKV